MTTTRAQWKPLEDLVGERADGFMFMGTVNGPRVWPEGPTIYLYKHEITRRYLNIDEAGNCYRFGFGGLYAAIDRTAAIEHAFS